jgi:hypothetical protein
MERRGHDDGVQIARFEEFAVIAEDGNFSAENPAGFCEARLIDVTDRADLHARKAEEVAH